eukprot:217760-Chlamydomonas_euryale.AAC.13
MRLARPNRRAGRLSPANAQTPPVVADSTDICLVQHPSEYFAPAQCAFPHMAPGQPRLRPQAAAFAQCRLTNLLGLLLAGSGAGVGGHHERAGAGRSVAAVPLCDAQSR